MNLSIKKRSKINKIGYLIITRLGSERLKEKAKLKINNKSIIEIIILRLLKITTKKNIVICTSKNENNIFYKKLVKKYKIKFFEGSNTNVLERMLLCSNKNNFEYVFRITGDNPLIDFDFIEKVKKLSNIYKKDYYYCNNIPRGMRSELIKVFALERLSKLIIDANSSEYLSYYFFRKDFFKIKIIKLRSFLKKEKYLSFSVDDFLKYKIIKNLINTLTKKEMSNRRDILKGIINLSKNNIEKLKIQNTKLIPLVTKKYDVRLKGDLKNEKILSLY
tara:strand:+ start:167 stop:994 length:828 start_codon:yes stop_codon:yes gene_type:complete